MQSSSCRFGRFKSFVVSGLEFFAGQHLNEFNLDNSPRPKQSLKARFLFWGYSVNHQLLTTNSHGVAQTGSSLDPWSIDLLGHPSQPKQTNDTWDSKSQPKIDILLFLRTQSFLSQSTSSTAQGGGGSFKE